MEKGESTPERELNVYVVPDLVPPARLSGGVAVVMDVLRATTTIVHALAAGCKDVRPCADLTEAQQLADGMRAGRVILAGEREGEKVPGFDRGNSPGEFTPSNSKGCSLVLSTSNGTRAILRAVEADRVLIAGFVNFSAVCEQLRFDPRPLHLICAGHHGEPSFEDTLLAGALVEAMCDYFELKLNDSARLAWDAFETNGHVLRSALDLGRGGQLLHMLGLEADIALAAAVDHFTLVPELKRDPIRIEIASCGIVKSYWTK